MSRVTYRPAVVGRHHITPLAHGRSESLMQAVEAARAAQAVRPMAEYCVVEYHDFRKTAVFSLEGEVLS